MKLQIASAAVVSLVAVAQPAVAATSVAGASSSVTDLGNFAAGTYHITATGVIEFAGSPGLFDTGPNGVPVTPVTASGYSYCNPGGCSVDIPGDGGVGPGGAAINFGTLLGTLSASPSSPSDFFTIGYGTNVTLAAAGNIYALVNDTYRPNDVGSYDVSVAAVPEPASWAMMIGGFGMVGGAMRRRKLSAKVTYA